MKFNLAYLVALAASVAVVDAAPDVSNFTYQAYKDSKCTTVAGKKVTITQAQFGDVCKPVTSTKYYKAKMNGPNQGCALFYYSDTACSVYAGMLTEGGCQTINAASKKPASIIVQCGG